ncbi:lysylphosphatidylglycerol synthase transmembrane domain-containing protein [Sphaerisporangium fuscum]|uniref:lysylphosphatidylglycerol synthase transmembrane domain-containing protein n=1 Tax=Sphaerisporangium fuscum TaxID=2835868 RepID=UPI001BDCF2B4|nr:lysylphosphatidylglycerol synthase transmembrane domain-containing protein [Sphaerisporangium fuscum]
MTRRLWPWLRLLLAVGILALVAWRLGTGAFVDGLRLVDGRAVVAALAIGLLTTVFSVWRWCLVARRLGLPLPARSALADYYQALFLNAVLPAGVLGDAHRAVNHGRHVGDVGRGVRAVVLERVGGQLVLVAAGIVVLLADPSLAGSVARDVAPGLGVTVAALAGVTVAGVLVAARARRGGRQSRWRAAVTAAVADTRHGLLARDTWPGVVALSAAALLGHLTLFVVAARTAGSTAPIGRLLPLTLLALLVMALPVNVGGWGPREAFLAVAFGAAGLGARQGLTTAVVYGVLAFAASLPGAAVLLLRRGTAGARPAVNRTDAVAVPPAGDGSFAEDSQVVAERPDEALEHGLSLRGRGQ